MNCIKINKHSAAYDLQFYNIWQWNSIKSFSVNSQLPFFLFTFIHLKNIPIEIVLALFPSSLISTALQNKATLRPKIKMYKKSTIKMIYSHSSNQYQWYFNIFVISARFSYPKANHFLSRIGKNVLYVYNGALIESYYFWKGIEENLYLSVREKHTARLVFDFKSAINLIYSIKAR